MGKSEEGNSNRGHYFYKSLYTLHGFPRLSILMHGCADVPDGNLGCYRARLDLMAWAEFTMTGSKREGGTHTLSPSCDMSMKFNSGTAENSHVIEKRVAGMSKD